MNRLRKHGKLGSNSDWAWYGIKCLVLIVSLLCCALAGSQTRAQSQSAAPSKSQDLETSSEEIKVEEIEQLGKKLVQLVAQGQYRDVDRLIKWDRVVDRALQKIPADDSTFAFRQGFLETVGGPGGFSSNLNATAQNGGSFRFLKSLKRDDKSIALFRLILPEGGFNYIEMEVAKVEGQLVVVDVYPYSNGEWTSLTVRRAFVTLSDFTEELDGTEEALVRNAEEFTKFSELVSAGEAEKAMEIYERLPIALQKEKSTLLLRLRAAQQLGNDEYGRALAMIRREYPADPSSDLLSLDAFVLAKRYDEALKCVERLDQRVDGDQFLKLQRAGIKILQESYGEAEELAQSVIDEDDLKLEAYWTLVTISLRREQFAETLRLLKEMDQTFAMQWADFRQVPDYAEFVKADQYEAWTEYLKSK